MRVPAAARLGGTQTLLFAERRRQVVPESVAPCFSFGDADAVRDLKQAYALAQQQDGTRSGRRLGAHRGGAQARWRPYDI